MVHYARQQPLPPLKMTLSTRSGPMPVAKRAPLPPAPASAPPPMCRKASVERLVSSMVQAVELRYRNLREAFRTIDKDSSGTLSRDELQYALFLWHIQAQGRHVDGIMAEFDRDRNGELTYAEWCEGLKPFSVTSKAVFGLEDRHVTNRHTVLPGAGRVLINDNLTPNQRSAARPRRDYELIELPGGAPPASPEVLRDATNQLSNRIHDKFKQLKDAFRSFDENKDGKLSKQELMTAVRCFNLPIPREHVMQIAQLCDADADGQIDYNEFAAVLKRKDAIGH